MADNLSVRWGWGGRGRLGCRARLRRAGRVLLRQGRAKGRAPEQTAAASLEGKSLNIYCGAGMTKPFQEIADAFKAETGCEMNIAFANAAQIQTQPGEMAKNRIAKAAVPHSLTVPPASALFVGAW